MTRVPPQSVQAILPLETGHLAVLSSARQTIKGRPDDTSSRPLLRLRIGAAVDSQCRTGDVLRLRARKERDRVGDVVRRAIMAHGHELLEHGGERAVVRVHVGVDRAAGLGQACGRTVRAGIEKFLTAGTERLPKSRTVAAGCMAVQARDDATPAELRAVAAAADAEPLLTRAARCRVLGPIDRGRERNSALVVPTVVLHTPAKSMAARFCRAAF